MGDFEDWFEKRNRVLRNLDTTGLMEAGASYEVAITALHKARYESIDMDGHLRRQSREWLEKRGYSRMCGLPWPDDEELPT